MKFSILHTTARPDQWRAAYDAWISAAAHPENVEYILVVDERWGFAPNDPILSGWESAAFQRSQLNVLDWNNLPYTKSGYVAGVNIAASRATGDLLIAIADDFFPPGHWDQQLEWLISDKAATGAQYPDDVVIWPDTGTPNERERTLMPMPILSRARYERLGYVFFPLFESMYADNDFCEHALADQAQGISVTFQTGLRFEHRNPWCKGVENLHPEDDVYRAGNSQEAYARGKAVLDARRMSGFKSQSAARDFKQPATHSRWRRHLDTCTCGLCGTGQRWVVSGPHSGEEPKHERDLRELMEAEVKHGLASTSHAGGMHPDFARYLTDTGFKKPKRIAFILSGEWFSSAWVAKFIEVMQICQTHDTTFLMGYNTNVYMTRFVAAENALSSEFESDYVLWIDDDNPISLSHVLQLLNDLEYHPEIGMVAGWTLTGLDGYGTERQLSCGLLKRKRHPSTQQMVAVFKDLKDSEFTDDLTEVDYTGFPLVLMRTGLLRKVGAKGFAPMPWEDSKLGFLSEDMAFCMRAKQAGFRIFVDRRVCVPHLKLRDIAGVGVAGKVGV